MICFRTFFVQPFSNGTGINLPSTINGTYKISYDIYEQAGSGSVYTETYAFDYSFTLPVGSVGLTATMSSSLLTSTDSTVYGSSYTNDSLTRTHSIHPPAGANPVIAILGAKSFEFVIMPVAIGASFIIIFALFYNKLMKR